MDRSKKTKTKPFPSARLSMIKRRVVENRVHVEFNSAESPLTWLRTRKDSTGHSIIDDQQYCAGLRLHSDFCTARLLPRVTSNWQAPLSSRAARRSSPRNDLLHQSEKVLAAKQRYHAALEAVGPELSKILVEICCFSFGIEATEQSLGWPRRSGKVVLQLALTRLARWYGIIAPEKPIDTKIAGSAIAGYRPTIG